VTALAKLLGLAAILAAGLDFNEDRPSAPLVDFSGRTCLALVGFSEARDQDDAGMAATMQVVINRAIDPAGRWPRTLCDVALQPGQFVGLDRWPTPRHPERIDVHSWARALDIADQVIAGSAPVPFACSAATAFDQNAHIDRAGIVCRLGAHTFYAAPPIVAAN
jgi:spore germination cell wall hydrolase CwlJ-like protein